MIIDQEGTIKITAFPKNNYWRLYCVECQLFSFADEDYIRGCSHHLSDKLQKSFRAFIFLKEL